MKKIILSAALCGGMLLGTANGIAVHADTLSSSTAVSAEVTRGDVTLAVDPTVDFASQPLAATVDFGSKDINYSVTDYSGETDGYQITAKLTDEADATRTVTVGGVTLSNEAAQVASKTTNEVGENADTLAATLSYTGIKQVKDYSTSIEWNLVNTPADDIGE
jgi:hypothetical protein